MHHGLTHALEMQLFQVWKLLDDSNEMFEMHEGGSARSRTIFSEHHGAHAALKIALTDRLNLEKGRKHWADVD
jgi:hypothetical protein